MIRQFLTFFCALLEGRAKETTRCYYSSNDRFVGIKSFVNERNEVASSRIKVGLLRHDEAAGRVWVDTRNVQECRLNPTYR